jgi:hypothetical protein
MPDNERIRAVGASWSPAFEQEIAYVFPVVITLHLKQPRIQTVLRQPINRAAFGRWVARNAHGDCELIGASAEFEPPAIIERGLPMRAR